MAERGGKKPSNGSKKIVTDQSHKCQVCSNSSKHMGLYFGASGFCCDSCRTFYKKFYDHDLDDLSQLESCVGSCDLADRKCKKCRMQMCLKVGMEYSKGKVPKAKLSQKSTAKEKSKVSGPKKSRLSLKGTKLQKHQPGTKGTLDGWSTAHTEQTKSDESDEITEENSRTIEDETRVPCVASLHNLGNTCYLNSVMQVLRYTPQFDERLKDLAKQIHLSRKERRQTAELSQTESPDEKEEDYSTWDVVRHLDGVFNKMNNAEERFMNGSSFIGTRPYELLDTIGRLNPMFEGNQQQDAHEFMRCLLSYIQDASRSLNKYRCRVAEKLNKDSCNYVTEETPLMVSAKEVEMLGGLKEAQSPQRDSSPVNSKEVTPTAKTRSSKRLSSSRPKDENLTQKQEVSPKEEASSAVKSPTTKKTSRGRKSLTELQNHAFSGQRLILDCYTVRSSSNGDIGVAVNGSSNGVGKCDDTGEKEVGNVIRGHPAKRLTNKRKAGITGSEECNYELDDRKGEANQTECGDDQKQLTHKKRRFHSSERGKEGVEEEPSVTHKGQGHLIQNGREHCSKTSQKVDTHDKNEGHAGTDVGQGQGDNRSITAEMKMKTVVERKHTARKTICPLRPDSDREELPRELPLTKPVFVKIDKHGIANYFRKVSKPQSLSEIEHHVEPVADGIEEIFQGHVELWTRCSDCEKITTRREEYQDISVAVQRKHYSKDESEEETEAELEDKGAELGDNGLGPTAKRKVIEDRKVKSEDKGEGLDVKKELLEENGTGLNARGVGLEFKGEEPGDEEELDDKEVIIKGVGLEDKGTGLPHKGVGLEEPSTEITLSKDHSVIKQEDLCKALSDIKAPGDTPPSKSAAFTKTTPRKKMTPKSEKLSMRSRRKATLTYEDDFLWVRESLGEVERLQEDNKYWCDSCCHLAEAERSMHYTSVPNILTLHLKRFAMSHGSFGGFTKLTDHVPLPMMLPCIEDNCTQPQKHRLELYGVITHTGFTLSCGHYTAYIRAPDHSPALYDPDIIKQTNLPPGAANPNLPLLPPGDINDNCDDVSMVTGEETRYWFECDDEVITVLKEKDFLARLSPESNSTTTPYLLFYQRLIA